MIILILGAPGTGKTTVCRALSERYGTPYFEMSWMPEFLRLNGVRIDYEQDERIAVAALLSVAKAYIAGGHRVVLVSDFRLKTLSSVYAQLKDVPHQVIRLVCSDSDVLSARVLNPDRPSGSRNVEEALCINAAYVAMHVDEHIVLDVAHADVDDIVRILEERILIPNNAMRMDVDHYA